MSAETRDTPPESGREQGNAPSGTARMSVEVVHPATGEVLALDDATTDTLADWRMSIVELKSRLDELASALDVQIAERLDFEGVRSATVGPYKLEVSAPTKVSYDVETLGIVLEALVLDGRISRGVAERAIKTEVSRSARVAELNKLLGHADPEVRDSIAGQRQETPVSRRYVRVRLEH